MSIQRFAIHSYEFNSTTAQYPGTFFIERISEAGIVEGTYMTLKPLTVAIRMLYIK